MQRLFRWTTPVGRACVASIQALIKVSTRLVSKGIYCVDLLQPPDRPSDCEGGWQLPQVAFKKQRSSVQAGTPDSSSKRAMQCAGDPLLANRLPFGM